MLLTRPPSARQRGSGAPGGSPVTPQGLLRILGKSCPVVSEAPSTRALSRSGAGQVQRRVSGLRGLEGGSLSHPSVHVPLPGSNIPSWTSGLTSNGLFPFFKKFRVLGGLCYYYFLNFSKSKKVLFGACSKVAIFLMGSTRFRPHEELCQLSDHSGLWIWYVVSPS